MTIDTGEGLYDDLDSFLAATFEDSAEASTLLAESPAPRPILEAILAHARTLHEERVELHANVEAHGREPLRSEERRSDALGAKVAKAHAFMGDVLDRVEAADAGHNRMEHQRTRFNQVIRGGRPMDTTSTELNDWLRHGGSPTFDVPLETHDLTTGGGSAGGVVPAGFVGNFYLHMIANAALRQTNVQIYTTTGGEPLKIPKSVTDPTAAQVAEGVAITPGDPALGSVTLGTYGFKAMTYVSRELVEDSSVDVEEILGRLLGRAIGTASGLQYVQGDGTTEPQGVNLSPVAGVTTTWALLGAGATGPDLLTDLYFSVNPPYRAQGFWFMNDATLAVVRKLKSTTNEYLVDRSLTTTPTETIFGRPVVTDPNMATGAGAKDVILFGDFSSYAAIRDVGGLRLERSDDFRFANDEIAYRAVLRTDSKQVLNDAANSAVKALHDTA